MLRTVCVVGAGDLAAQAWSGAPYDGARAAHMMALGTFTNVVVVRGWYGVLWRRFPATTHRATLLKVAADQAVLAPVGIAAAVGYTSWLQGEREFRWDRFWHLYAADLCVWPVTTYVNLRYVPRARQLLVYSVVSSGWYAYLSHRTH